MSSDLNQLLNAYPDSGSNVYVIMFYDEEVCTIDIESGAVELYKESLMPFGLYVTCSNEVQDCVNNIANFNSWCSSRLLSSERRYAKEILKTCGVTQIEGDRARAFVALKYSCTSLRDAYWVKNIYNSFTWENVNIRKNPLIRAYIDLFLTGKEIAVPSIELIKQDLSTDGVFPKAWAGVFGKLSLLKGGSDEDIEKEVHASELLATLGFDVVRYNRELYGSTLVSECQCFTSVDVNFVPADEYVCNFDIKYAVEHYASKKFYEMLIACYLVGNNDLHGGNWGFLFDSNRAIYDLAPIFDLNHCFEADPNTLSDPMILLGENMSQKDAAIMACRKLNADINNWLTLTENTYVRDRLLSLL